MTKKRFNFTIKTISTLAVFDTQSSTRTYYYDTHVRGLGIYVTAKAVKTYFVYKKIEGRPVRIVLGRVDEISLEKARAKAQDVHAQIADGIIQANRQQLFMPEWITPFIVILATAISSPVYAESWASGFAQGFARAAEEKRIKKEKADFHSACSDV